VARYEIAGWERRTLQLCGLTQLREDLLPARYVHHVSLASVVGELVPPETLRLLLDDYRVQHQKRLAELRRMESALGDARRLPAFTLRRGIAYQEMMVRWLEELSEFLTAG
jgi:Virulence activator alpha C-term